MATTHRRLSRKELRQPDEFVTFLDRVWNYVGANLPRIIIGAVAAIVILAIAFSWRFYRQYQSRIAAEEFYRAMTALDRKDYRTAERGFTALAEQHPGHSLGQLAEFYRANTYMAENAPAKARDALQKYLEGRGLQSFRQLALNQLGVAYEDLGDQRKAYGAYVQAAALDGPEKERAELGVARMLARMGDNRSAISAYRRFLQENPFASERAEVVESLALLGAAPEQPAVHSENFTVRPARTRSSSTPGGPSSAGRAGASPQAH
jgi:tetratricopeptide (TPR) repeat protein